MNKIKIFRSTGFVILCLSILVGLSGCGKNSDEQTDFTKRNTLVPVKVEKVSKHNITQRKTLAGSLEGVEQSSIISKISERITNINFRVNDFVKKGQIVFLLENTGPSSNYLQTKANFANSETELERMKNLYQNGAISKQTLDQVETGYEVAKANFEAAKSTVELTSPISGILTDIKTNVGNWVTPGSELAIIANINYMILKFSVSEMEMQRLKMGEEVYIYSDFGNKEKVEGKIIEISRSASSDARSFQVKAKFKNTKDLWYKPGLFVKVDIILESKNDILSVPTTSIVNNNGRTTVYVLNDNKTSVVQIQTGLANDDYTEIINGLNEGDTLVTVGMNNLKENSQVTIVK